MGKPLIWVLCGVRAGDTAQALELARRVGGRVVEKRFAFNALHHLPNLVLPAGFHTLKTDARTALEPPWPDLIIATGKRTAPVALAIRKMSGGRTRLVQLGRPRMALTHFDLVITTPQYGLPPAANVITLPTPFAVPKVIDPEARAFWQETWKNLPRPWLMATIGASKYPLKLGPAELAQFARHVNAAAGSIGASVLLFDSPRSEPGALASVASLITAPKWLANNATHKGAYQAGLALADRFAVTGDSVSMASEMLATGKPVAVHRLPRQIAPRWSAQKGFAASLARSGLLSPPRDVDGFIKALVADGQIGVLGQGWGSPSPGSTAHDAAAARVRRLVDLS